jgi:hypothetical protein
MEPAIMEPTTELTVEPTAMEPTVEPTTAPLCLDSSARHYRHAEQY